MVLAEERMFAHQSWEKEKIGAGRAGWVEEEARSWNELIDLGCRIKKGGLLPLKFKSHHLPTPVSVCASFVHWLESFSSIIQPLKILSLFLLTEKLSWSQNQKRVSHFILFYCDPNLHVCPLKLASICKKEKLKEPSEIKEFDDRLLHFLHWLLNLLILPPEGLWFFALETLASAQIK